MHRVTPEKIAVLFRDGVSELGGQVTDCLVEPERLFARSLLMRKQEVRLGDVVEGGIAVCLLQDIVSVRPYVFRLACNNGAVFADSDVAAEIDLRAGEPGDNLKRIHEAICACGSPSAFEASVSSMRSAVYHPINLALSLAALRAELPGVTSDVIFNIIDKANRKERTLFALMNVVTATARDTEDPELRWKLEEVGGSIPALLMNPDYARELGDFLELPNGLEGGWLLGPSELIRA